MYIIEPGFRTMILGSSYGLIRKTDRLFDMIFKDEAGGAGFRGQNEREFFCQRYSFLNK
jgi:hypothetical protein